MSVRVWLGVAMMMVGAGTVVFGNTIWKEDFTDVSDWSVIYDPGKGSTITTDGNIASFHVSAGGSEAVFVPAADVSPYIPFDPAKKSHYTLTLTVEKITASTSYDIAIDQFKAAGSSDFIGTAWHVFPTNGTSIATGTTVIDLGACAFDPNTKFIMPKVSVHTGNPDQTVEFDLMKVDYIP